MSDKDLSLEQVVAILFDCTEKTAKQLTARGLKNFLEIPSIELTEKIGEREYLKLRATYFLFKKIIDGMRTGELY